MVGRSIVGYDGGAFGLAVVEVPVDACSFVALCHGFEFGGSDGGIVVLILQFEFDGVCGLFAGFEGYFDESRLVDRLLRDVFDIEYCTFFVFMFECFKMGSVIRLVSSFDLRMKLFFADGLHFCGLGASHEGIELIVGVIIVEPSSFEFFGVVAFPIGFGYFG